MSSIHTSRDGLVGKVCSKCRLWQPLQEFHRDRHCVDELDCKCKSCKSAYKHSAAGRASARRYNLTASGQASHKSYRQSAKGIATKKKRVAAYRKRFPGKRKAQAAVTYAIKLSKIPRASACKCTNCGLQACDYHHESYEKEHWLDVIPLCRACHKLIHRQSS